MIDILVSQAGGVPESPFSLGGILAIISAVVAGIVTIITTWRTGSKVEDVRKINSSQDVKLDNITVLVNGRYYEALREIAEVRMNLAKATGSEIELINARIAAKRADEQKTRVLEAERRQISRAGGN